MRILEIKIPPSKEFISPVRYSAGIYANTLGFDLETIEDIKLAVGEACNNAVLYGDPDLNEVLVKFYSEDKSMFVEITDKGYGFETNKYESPDLEDPEGGGLGIYIIKTLSDGLEYRSDDNKGTILTIRFDLK